MQIRGSAGAKVVSSGSEWGWAQEIKERAVLAFGGEKNMRNRWRLFITSVLFFHSATLQNGCWVERSGIGIYLLQG